MLASLFISLRGTVYVPSASVSAVKSDTVLTMVAPFVRPRAYSTFTAFSVVKVILGAVSVLR